MERDQALRLLREHLTSPNLIKHSLATEAILRSLAGRLGEDQDLWGIVGLLHDLDLELVENDMSIHGLKTTEILEGKELPQEALEAIRMHNAEGLGLGERSTLFQHALAASETITGLIVATALVLPSKRLEDVKASSVRKRMKEKAFARGARREVIMECEKAGVPLEEFIDLSLEAMKEISEELGL